MGGGFGLMLFGGWWFWGGLVGWCGGGEVEVECRNSEFSCTWGGGSSFLTCNPWGFWVLRGRFWGLRGPPLYFFYLGCATHPPFGEGGLFLRPSNSPMELEGQPVAGRIFQIQPATLSGEAELVPRPLSASRPTSGGSRNENGGVHANPLIIYK